MSEGNAQKNGLWRSSSILYRYSQIYLARNLESIGIGRGASQVVPLIVKYPGITQDGLANKIRLDKGSVARAVWQLEDDGYIKREPDENDARANRIFPTQKLYRHASFIEKVMGDWCDMVMDGVDENLRDALLAALDKMAENAKLIVDKK